MGSGSPNVNQHIEIAGEVTWKSLALKFFHKNFAREKISSASVRFGGSEFQCQFWTRSLVSHTRHWVLIVRLWITRRSCVASAPLNILISIPDVLLSGHQSLYTIFEHNVSSYESTHLIKLISFGGESIENINGYEGNHQWSYSMSSTRCSIMIHSIGVLYCFYRLLN